MTRGNVRAKKCAKSNRTHRRKDTFEIVVRCVVVKGRSLMMTTPPTRRRNRRGHTSLSFERCSFAMKPFSLSLSLSPRRFRLPSPVGKPERRERNLAPKRRERERVCARVNSRSSVSSLSLSLCGLSPPLKARQIPEESKRESERENKCARSL